MIKSSGSEIEHLAGLLASADTRGSDVHIATGTLVDGSRLNTPYPASVWAWSHVLDWQWRNPGHINQGEFAAFLVYLWYATGTKGLRRHRCMHVFDSRVVASILTKGRSSSVRLNRLCRRAGAVILAADLHVVCLWTISGWSFCDAGSRI